MSKGPFIVNLEEVIIIIKALKFYRIRASKKELPIIREFIADMMGVEEVKTILEK